MTMLNPALPWTAGNGVSTLADLVTWARVLGTGALLSPSLAAQQMVGTKLQGAGGNHAAVAAWRQKMAAERTKARGCAPNPGGRAVLLVPLSFETGGRWVGPPRRSCASPVTRASRPAW